MATATIDAAWTEDTDTAANYKLVKLEYDLGIDDVIRLVSPLIIFRKNSTTHPQYTINGLGANKFDQEYPLAEISAGVPEAFKEVKVADNTRTIVLSHYSESERMKVQYSYIKLRDDLTDDSEESEIYVPREYRYVVADWALALLLADKSDDKAKDALNKAQAGYMNMIKDDKMESLNIDPKFGQFISREDNV